MKKCRYHELSNPTTKGEVNKNLLSRQKFNTYRKSYQKLTNDEVI